MSATFEILNNYFVGPNLSLENMVVNENTGNKDFTSVNFENTITGPFYGDSNLYLPENYVVFSIMDSNYIFGSKVKLNNLSLSNMTIENLQMQSSSLQNCQLQNSNISNVNFNDADLSGSDFSNSFLTDVSFIGTNMNNVDFSNCQMNGVTFDDNNLRTTTGLNFHQTTIQNVKGINFPISIHGNGSYQKSFAFYQDTNHTFLIGVDSNQYYEDTNNFFLIGPNQNLSNIRFQDQSFDEIQDVSKCNFSKSTFINQMFHIDTIFQDVVFDQTFIGKTRNSSLNYLPSNYQLHKNYIIGPNLIIDGNSSYITRGDFQNMNITVNLNNCLIRNINFNNSFVYWNELESLNEKENINFDSNIVSLDISNTIFENVDFQHLHVRYNIEGKINEIHSITSEYFVRFITNDLTEFINCNFRGFRVTNFIFEDNDKGLNIDDTNYFLSQSKKLVGPYMNFFGAKFVDEDFTNANFEHIYSTHNKLYLLLESSTRYIFDLFYQHPRSENLNRDTNNDNRIPYPFKDNLFLGRQLNPDSSGYINVSNIGGWRKDSTRTYGYIDINPSADYKHEPRTRAMLMSWWEDLKYTSNQNSFYTNKPGDPYIFPENDTVFDRITTHNTFDKVPTFTNCKMPGCNFKDAKMRYWIFDSCDMAGSSFNETDCKDIRIINSSLQGSHLRNSKFVGATLDQSNLTDCVFIDVTALDIKGNPILDTNYYNYLDRNLINQFKGYIIGPNMILNTEQFDVNLNDVNLDGYNFINCYISQWISFENSLFENCVTGPFRGAAKVIPAIRDYDSNYQYIFNKQSRQGFIIGPGIKFAEIGDLNTFSNQLYRVGEDSNDTNTYEEYILNFSYLTIDGASFQGITFHNGISLIGTKFINTITGPLYGKTNLIDTNEYQFIETSLLLNETIYYIIGEGVILNHADLRGCDLNILSLRNSSLTDVVIDSNTSFTNCLFENTVTGPILGYTNKLPENYKMLFDDSNRPYNYIIGPNVVITHADLSGINLDNYNFENVDFVNIKFDSNTDFSNIDMTSRKTGPNLGTDSPILPEGYQIFSQTNTETYFTEIDTNYFQWIVGPSVNLSNAKLANNNLINISLENCLINNETDFTACNFTNVVTSNIQGKTFRLPNINYSFVGSNIIGPHVRIQNTNLDFLDFTNSTISENTIFDFTTLITQNPVKLSNFLLTPSFDYNSFLLNNNLNSNQAILYSPKKQIRKRLEKNSSLRDNQSILIAIPYSNLDDYIIQDISFENLDLSNSSFKNTSFSDISFRNTNLSNALCNKNTSFINCNFLKSKTKMRFDNNQENKWVYIPIQMHKNIGGFNLYRWKTETVPNIISKYSPTLNSENYFLATKYQDDMNTVNSEIMIVGPGVYLEDIEFFNFMPLINDNNINVDLSFASFKGSQFFNNILFTNEQLLFQFPTNSAKNSFCMNFRNSVNTFFQLDILKHLGFQQNSTLYFEGKPINTVNFNNQGNYPMITIPFEEERKLLISNPDENIFHVGFDINSFNFNQNIDDGLINYDFTGYNLAYCDFSQLEFHHIRADFFFLFDTNDLHQFKIGDSYYNTDNYYQNLYPNLPTNIIVIPLTDDYINEKLNIQLRRFTIIGPGTMQGNNWIDLTRYDISNLNFTSSLVNIIIEESQLNDLNINSYNDSKRRERTNAQLALNIVIGAANGWGVHSGNPILGQFIDRFLHKIVKMMATTKMNPLLTKLYLIYTAFTIAYGGIVALIKNRYIPFPVTRYFNAQIKIKIKDSNSPSGSLILKHHDLNHNYRISNSVLVGPNVNLRSLRMWDSNDHLGEFLVLNGIDLAQSDFTDSVIKRIYIDSYTDLRDCTYNQTNIYEVKASKNAGKFKIPERQRLVEASIHMFKNIHTNQIYGSNDFITARHSGFPVGHGFGTPVAHTVIRNFVTNGMLLQRYHIFNKSKNLVQSDLKNTPFSNTNSYKQYIMTYGGVLGEGEMMLVYPDLNFRPSGYGSDGYEKQIGHNVYTFTSEITNNEIYKKQNSYLKNIRILHKEGIIFPNRKWGVQNFWGYHITARNTLLQHTNYYEMFYRVCMYENDPTTMSTSYLKLNHRFKDDYLTYVAKLLSNWFILGVGRKIIKFFQGDLNIEDYNIWLNQMVDSEQCNEARKILNG